MHIAHGHHTGRKVDLYGGQYTDFDDTINHLRDDMEQKGGDMACPWDPPCDDHYEEAHWPQPSKGVCNVPQFARGHVDNQVGRGMIVVTDNYRDDYEDLMTKGTFWVYDDRARGKP